MSNIVDLSYKQTLMDTDNESNLLVCNNNSHTLSSVNTSKNDTFMELYVATSALNTFEFILSNGGIFISRNINDNQNELNDYEQQQHLTNLVQNYGGRQTLTNLIGKFVEHYDIYLHFVAFDQEKFSIINKYSFPDKAKPRNQAFVVLNGDDTVCGPLFAHDLTGRIQTVFALDDMRIEFQVDKYIEKLNRTDPRLFPVIQVNPISTVNQHSSNDMPVNVISALVNDFNSEILDSSQHTSEIHTSDDQIIQQTIQTNDTLSILPTIPEQYRLLPRNQENAIFSGEGNNHQDNTVQSNESDRVREADQISAHFPASSSTHLSNAMQDSQTIPAPPSTRIVYEKPEILKKPKKNWKTRYSKDLIRKPKKETNRKPRKTPKYKRKIRKPTEKEREIQFIGFLQSVGRQRSQIIVKVPSKEQRKMYLATTVRTINNQHHSLKVIVPEKTKVNKNRFNRENHLNYLEFDECNPMHSFDLDKRIVYMEITSEEHSDKRKKVPVYMFNLYQNQRLTKEMIEREQLDKCQLAFWLCVKEGENYIPISDEEVSWIITEIKKKKKNAHP